MPNRKKRARRRQGGAGVILPVLIVIVALAAAALAIVLVYSNPLAPERENNLPYDYGDLNFEESGGATAIPLVLGPSATPAPEQESASSDGVESEEGSASDAIISNGSEWRRENTDLKMTNRLIPTPMPGDYYLPIFDKALRTPDDTPMIAITIDGCDKVEVMQQILTSAAFYGAELTLFPSGDALMSEERGFRTYVSSFNCELENCTFDKSRRDYTLSSGELALQIWRQSIATSYSVSRDYQQHFYRPSTKQSAYDQRTHYFIRKLDFLGVATYTHSYRDHNIDSLVASLENGNIYQFDMTDRSMSMIDKFMEEASRKGYKLVTLNELFGLDANEIGSSLTISQQTLPEIADYAPTYYDLKLNYRTNAIYSLQTRLINLGYLQPANDEVDVRADGIYGSDTSIAVSKFQAKVGIVATGNADVETQQRLFAEDAPAAE